MFERFSRFGLPSAIVGLILLGIGQVFAAGGHSGGGGGPVGGGGAANGGSVGGGPIGGGPIGGSSIAHGVGPAPSSTGNSIKSLGPSGASNPKSSLGAQNFSATQSTQHQAANNFKSFNSLHNLSPSWQSGGPKFA